MDVDGIVAALLKTAIPAGPLVAALPMYDWPEERLQVEAQWAQLRDALRAKGVDAPERLARSNADLPGSDLPPDEFDLAALWQHPGLLFAQTCWGPMEMWLSDKVRVVGQDDYSGFEGGEGEYYRSAIVMRAGTVERVFSEAPPPLTYRGEPPVSPAFGPHKGEGDGLSESPSHLQGGARGAGASLITLMSGQRFGYNAPDSMSGYLALERDLLAHGSSLDIFSERIVSGGHRASICMVARGAADVAAVDCKTWALALRHEPAAKELMVVGWTTRRKGLPFITGLPRTAV